VSANILLEIMIQSTSKSILFLIVLLLHNFPNKCNMFDLNEWQISVEPTPISTQSAVKRTYMNKFM
jgi:hypothetical protein